MCSPEIKQGKRAIKKYLSKEAIRQITYKQIVLRVHRRTRNEEDNTNDKKAINAPTTEIKKHKRSYGKISAKTNHKSCDAYVKSKKNYETGLDHYNTVMEI